ncbi:MAG: regulatory protein RecX [candidate division Zixibacteria bacterium]
MISAQEYITIIDIGRRGMVYHISFSNDVQIRAMKGIIDKLNLSAGDEFTDSEFEKLKNILDESFAKYTAESILARRAHSVGELKIKLRQKDISGDLIKSIVGRFRKDGLLDDYNYGKMRAESLLRRKPAGRGYLIRDLQNKLVPRQIAESVITEILAEVDESELAAQLLEKKRISLTKFDLETARQKAYTYLSRRAISYGAAKTAFDKVFDKNEFKRGE